MKKSQLAIIINFLLFVFVTFAYSAKSSENLTLEDVLKGIQSSQTEITSGKWAVVYKHNETPYQADEAWVLGFKLTDYSADRSREPVWAYRWLQKDLKEERYVRTLFSDGKRQLSITEFPSGSPPMIENSEGFYYFEIRKLLGRCFEIWLSPQAVKDFLPLKNLPGEYMISNMMYMANGNNTLERFTIDANKGFCIKRIEYFRPPDAEEPYTFYDFFDYRSSKEGIWYPCIIRHGSYDFAKKTKKNIEEWNILKVEVNMKFPEDFFQIPEKY
jgi:hypothetical protein